MLSRLLNRACTAMLLAGILAISAIACAAPSANQADLVLHHGKVVTVDDAVPDGEAGLIHTYIHPPGKVGVAIRLATVHLPAIQPSGNFFAQMGYNFHRPGRSRFRVGYGHSQCSIGWQTLDCGTRSTPGQNPDRMAR